MRLRTRLVAVAAVLTLAGVGTAVAATRHHKREVLKPPVLSIEQTSRAVKIHIHNPNNHWGLYNQRLVLDLHDSREGFSIIRSYGPSGSFTAPGPGDNRKLPCCLIDRLPPGGDFTFTLWPTTSTVTRAKIDLYGPIGWRYE